MKGRRPLAKLPIDHTLAMWASSHAAMRVYLACGSPELLTNHSCMTPPTRRCQAPPSVIVARLAEMSAADRCELHHASSMCRGVVPELKS